MANEDKMKQFAQATEDLLSSFEDLVTSMSDEEKQAFSVDNGRGPVGLRDTDKFATAVDIISSTELRDMRREVASAIVRENYIKGAMMAFKIISMFGGMP